MVLSYLQRVICLMGVSMVLLQVATELVLFITAPILLRLLQSLCIRHRERALYVIQLSPLLIALLFTTFFCVPRYVWAETNFSSEGVGLVGLVLATGLYLWWLARIIAGLRIVLRTVSFGRACKLASVDIVTTANMPPIVMGDSLATRVALVGLAHPFIFISRRLMEHGGLDPHALDVVIDHERAHAAQLDNWKILSLHCLPRLHLKVSRGRTWFQLWQNAAESAADEDAIRGSDTRAFLLAETLVSLAHLVSHEQPQAICTYLVCAESELVLRVERLIHRTPERPIPHTFRSWFTLGCVAVAAAILFLSLRSVLGSIPEQLLHLG